MDDGKKYPDWWPTSMSGPYRATSGGFNNDKQPKKHSQEGTSYSEKYKPKIKEYSKSDAFSYLDKKTISDRSGTGSVNKWKTEKHPSHIEKCPKCGGVMRKRNGKYGPFLGCSNYPKCKYTRH